MGFIILLLYFVVVYLRPAEWTRQWRGLQLIDITTITAAVFLGMTLLAERRGFIKVPQNRMIVGMFFAIAMSHIVHTYFLGLVDSTVFFAKIVFIYFLVVNLVNSERKLRVTMWWLAILTCLLVFQGIYQDQHGYGWANQLPTREGRITWVGVFADPNDLGLAFVIMVPMLLGYVFRRSLFDYPGFKLVPIAMVGLLLYGIFLTNSRGAGVALMTAIAFYFTKKSKWVVPGGIIGGALASGFFVFGPSRMGLLSAYEAGAYGRLDSWYYGFQLLKSNPLFGVGMNMFTDAYPLTAHNSFVLIASELGMVGLFFWVGLFYVSFKGLSIVQKRHQGMAPLAYALQASLVGFGAAAFFLSRAYLDLPYLLFALCGACFHIARQENPAVEFTFTGKDRWHIILLSLGVLGLVQIAMKTWL